MQLVKVYKIRTHFSYFNHQNFPSMIVFPICPVAVDEKKIFFLAPADGLTSSPQVFRAAAAIAAAAFEVEKKILFHHLRKRFCLALTVFE